MPRPPPEKRIFHQDRKGVFLSGRAVNESKDFNKAKAEAASKGMRLSLPNGTYELIEHDNEVAFFKTIECKHPLGKWSWIVPITQILPEPHILSERVPINVIPKNYRGPVLHLKPPSEPKAKLWRYMSFGKFVSLLATDSIYFTRADFFNDDWEGALSNANKELREQVYKNCDLMPASFSELLEAYTKMKKWTYISCWFLRENESVSMWERYAEGAEGIAIQTNYDSVSSAFAGVFCTCVDYINYETDWIPELNSFYPFRHKRKLFEDETEFRAIIQRFPPTDVSFERREYFNLNQENDDCGLLLKVDLNSLIKKVVVSPYSQTWFRDTVQTLVNATGLKIRVESSEMAKKPNIF